MIQEVEGEGMEATQEQLRRSWVSSHFREIKLFFNIPLKIMYSLHLLC